jgi:uncharacterized protein YkwD
MTSEDVAEIFFRMWEKSSKHRKNMLSKEAKDIGISIHKIHRGKKIIFYGVQNFGRRLEEK